MSDPVSEELLLRAEQLLPGGVNSPVRAFRAVGGHPLFVREARGARIVSAQGREYIDFVGSWGPALLGHAEPGVVAAVQAAAARGLSFGAPTEGEVVLAERLTKLFPSIDMVRCVSSGTEATMSALRLARGHTRRPLIVKFDGAYHGHSDCLLVKAGSGAATFGAPDSAGVPEEIVKNSLSLPYNDVGALEQLFERDGDRIAAVIVEPVAGNMGCVPPEPGFLESILSLCERYGAVSIFDEVMTGCRLALGGAQQRYDLRPQLTCLGKVVGGGMPLAAYGGRRDIMEQIAPLGPVYQAGTLSGNPLAVAAALATLDRLDASVYERLESLGARLERGLRRTLDSAGVPGCVQRVGSMITLFFQKGPVRNWSDAERCDRKRFAAWHQGLIERGVYWPPSQFEAAFLSAAHTNDDIDQAIDAAAAALE